MLLFTVSENYLYFVIRFIPFFGLLKVYFSLWLILPQTKGAEFVYYKYIEPFISQHEEKIDKLASTLKPWEQVKLMASYAGSKTEPGKPEVRTKSYLDSFVDSFKRDASKNSSLAESLWGVLSTFGAGSGAATSHEAKTPEQSATDFDMVGKDEIANIVETAQQFKAAGWFNWWGGKSKTA